MLDIRLCVISNKKRKKLAQSEKLNAELTEKGYYVHNGVVNAKYFRERVYI